MPKYKDGKEIIYTIKEEKVEGYQVGYKRNGDIVNITNTYTPNKTSIEVQKIWEDDIDRDGKRLNEITIELLANGEKTGEVLVLNEKNNWQDLFIDLDEYEDGKKIIYSILEEEVQGYQSIIQGSAEKGFVVLNRHEIELIQISGIKTWDDMDNKNNERPTNIEINLLADGKKVASKVITKEDDWKYTFDQLPKNSNGKVIDYKIQEESVENYSSEVKGFNIINHYTPEKTSINVVKKWDDNQNHDKVRPNQIYIKLFANGKLIDQKLMLNKENDWQGEFSDLPVFENDVRIIYSIEEVSVENYQATTIKNSENSYTIINTHKTKKVEPTKTTKPSKIEKGKLPQTGEDINTYLFFGYFLLIVLFVRISYVIRQKRKSY